jgi:hypothetical protein
MSGQLSGRYMQQNRSQRKDMPKFPKKLYVSHENAGTKEEYLAADADAEAFADFSGSRHVGVYALIETIKVKTGVTLESIKLHGALVGIGPHKGNDHAHRKNRR